MNNITSDYNSMKIQMGSGSVDWVAFKSDYVYFDDMLVGTIADVNSKDRTPEKIKEYKRGIITFRDKINNYMPKDDLEIKEKEILTAKINLAEKIADLAISEIK